MYIHTHTDTYSVHIYTINSCFWKSSQMYIHIYIHLDIAMFIYSFYDIYICKKHKDV